MDWGLWDGFRMSQVHYMQVWVKCITCKFIFCYVAQFLTGLDWYWTVARKLGTPGLYYLGLCKCILLI